VFTDVSVVLQAMGGCMGRGYFVALFLLIAPAVPAGVCLAETITLKSGKTMEGTIVDEKDGDVKMDMGGIVLTCFKDEIASIDRTQPAASEEKPQPVPVKNTRQDAAPDGFDISLNDLIELDFKSKSEILNLRRNYVNQHPDFARRGYIPSEAVFGQIADGRPWWGIKGISCNGPGQESIEGLSEESRFLANPYLLVGVTEELAHIVHSSCSATYPRPTALFWHRSRDWGKVTYDAGTYMNAARGLKYPDADKFCVVAYNARDLGFSYLYIDKEKTKGIDQTSLSSQPVALNQYIHCGGSCGYSGGCNNMSPHEPHMIVRVTSLPAWIYVKLWKSKPMSASQQADMVFIVEMV
jgi:hypothetical protein